MTSGRSTSSRSIVGNSRFHISFEIIVYAAPVSSSTVDVDIHFNAVLSKALHCAYVKQGLWTGCSGINFINVVLFVPSEPSVGKKARSSARSIGKQLYSSVNLVDRLAITSCLQSPSIVADMSAFSVRLDNYVCTTLLANNREENQDGRPSHFLSFSYCFKLLTCCIRPFTR